ncbi:MAG: SPOR domain-containing protein [bacterium]
MDLALKQRLVGAIVLVVLAVIFVPMLLDGQPPSGITTEDLEIPPPDQPHLKTVVLELDQKNEDLEDKPGVTEEEALKVLAQASQQGIEQPENNLSVVDNNQPDSNVDPSIENNKLAVEQNNAEQAVVPVKVAEQEKPPAKVITPRKEDSKPVESKPVETKPVKIEKHYSTQTGSGYMLVLGSFSKKSNADNLAKKLIKANLKPHTDRVVIAGKKLYRVWLGEVSRDEAKQLQKEVAKILPKSKARVLPVSSAAASATTQSVDKPTKDKLRNWVVQVGVFSRKTNAIKLRDRVRGRDLRAYVEEVDVNGKKSFRVRVGPYVNKTDASAAMESLRKIGISGYLTRNQ